MKSLKAFYDGDKLELLSPFPKNLKDKKSYVILTFLEEDYDFKVTKAVKEGVMNLIKNEVYDLDTVLNEI